MVENESSEGDARSEEKKFKGERKNQIFCWGRNQEKESRYQERGREVNQGLRETDGGGRGGPSISPENGKETSQKLKRLP